MTKPNSHPSQEIEKIPKISEIPHTQIRPHLTGIREKQGRNDKKDVTLA